MRLVGMYKSAFNRAPFMLGAATGFVLVFTVTFAVAVLGS